MTTITKANPRLIKIIRLQIETLGDVMKEFEEAVATGIENHSRLIDAVKIAISELTDALQDHLPEAVAALRSAQRDGDVAKLSPTLAQAILEALEE